MRLESVVARNNELPSAPIDRDIVFLNPGTESYVALDEIGRRIWELLDRPRQISDLISALELEFIGPAEVITTDVMAFLAELKGDGMVRVIGDSL